MVKKNRKEKREKKKKKKEGKGKKEEKRINQKEVSVYYKSTSFLVAQILILCRFYSLYLNVN